MAIISLLLRTPKASPVFPIWDQSTQRGVQQSLKQAKQAQHCKPYTKSSKGCTHYYSSEERQERGRESNRLLPAAILNATLPCSTSICKTRISVGERPNVGTNDRDRRTLKKIGRQLPKYTIQTRPIILSDVCVGMWVGAGCPCEVVTKSESLHGILRIQSSLK